MNATTAQLNRRTLRTLANRLLLALTLGNFATSSPAQAVNHWVLAVGINEYSSGVSSLGACVNDANDVLSALAGDNSRWNPQRMYMLTDYDATKYNIRSGLYYLASVAQPGDVVVYFQSSHGGQSSQGSKATFLCATDGNYHDAEVGADLAAWFSDDVKVFFIVDACHSGGLIKDAGSTSREARDWKFGDNAMSAFMQARGIAPEARAKATGINVSFMTAADYNELSAERGRNGFFAGSLVHAMKNAAADQNGDGLLSFLEMHMWAATRASLLNPEQNAQLSNQSLLSRTTVTKRGSGNATISEGTGGGGGGGGGGEGGETCDIGLCCDMRGGAPLLMAIGFAGLVSDQRRRRMKQ